VQKNNNNKPTAMLQGETNLQRNDILALAQKSQLLEQRIIENSKSQQIDLNQWIFERLQIESGCRVLELCCGTGSQTMRLLEMVGSIGHVVALDAAKDAIEKLREKAGQEFGNRLSTVAVKMEDFPRALAELNLPLGSFDLMFCAYGLYYADDPIAILQDALSWLKPNGRIAIVGPYGSNNGPLFNLLGECGVEVPPFVLYTSRDFMESAVIPWAIGHFSKIVLNTMVNHVTWSNSESLITYWKNTTFYDDAKLTVLENKVKDYFGHDPFFVNEKWVMLVEMRHD
jgi:ubiquinone/menaquinone biosynthesis C-methylase UbiE